MPSRQSQQLDAANARLEQIQGVISAAQSELRQLQADIKLARRQRDLQTARLKKAYQQKAKEIRKEFEALSAGLQDGLTVLQQAVKDSTAEKGLAEYEIGELGRKLQRQQQEYDGARKDDAAKLVRLKDSVERASEALGAKEAELISLNDRLTKATKQVDHFEKLLVQAEESYTERVAELRSNLSAAESKLQQTERLVQEYESSMTITREVDEARRIGLERRENLLAAGKRALGQNRADFDAEKKRFYQTKSL